MSPGEPLNYFIPVARSDDTIASDILATTAAMRKNGTFDRDSLCWSPAELEALAMFAVATKNDLAASRAVPVSDRAAPHRTETERTE